MTQIECQLGGAWLSHREQMRYILTLKTWFLDKVLPGILPSIPHPSRKIRVMSPAKPVSIHLPPVCMKAPLTATAFSAESLFNISLNAREDLFSDERFRRIVNSVQALVSTEYVALAASVSGLGEYLVCAMGAFILERGPDGHEPVDSLNLTLWHGHVQIIGM